jgi:hypothetical protein
MKGNDNVKYETCNGRTWVVLTLKKFFNLDQIENIEIFLGILKKSKKWETFFFSFLYFVSILLEEVNFENSSKILRTNP